jgi:hypothetical protein
VVWLLFMHSTENRMRQKRKLRGVSCIIRQTFFLVVLLAAGCETFSRENTASRPWNRQTKEEISQNWRFWPWEYSSWEQQKDWKPGDHYP